MTTSANEVRLQPTDSSVCVTTEDPCDRPNRLLDEDVEVIHDEASAIFTFLCILV